VLSAAPDARQRESQYAYALGIDTPLGGMFAHQSNGTLRILERRRRFGYGPVRARGI